MSRAPIEKLPVELLQPVFVDSGCNLALLRASPRLQVKLSSEYVYNQTCDYHLTGVFGDRATLSEAQTYIFASKWMTWSFFKSWITRTFQHNGCLCGLTPDNGCFDAQWPPDFKDATRMVFSRSHLPRIAFVKGRIPKKLLKGPWTKDKVEFLRFLLWITSMTVDWRNPETRQIALEGRKQAMIEKNLEAVELFNHNRRLGKVADLSTVRFAVLEAGCDRSVVYDTLLTANLWGMRGPSWNCPELDKWIEKRIKKGDPKGQWLKTKLSELRGCLPPLEDNQEPPRPYSDFNHNELDPVAGDYNGGSSDRLVVHKLEWNKVSALIQFFRRLFWWW